MIKIMTIITIVITITVGTVSVMHPWVRNPNVTPKTAPVNTKRFKAITAGSSGRLYGLAENGQVFERSYGTWKELK